MDYVMTGKPTMILDRLLEFLYEKKKAKDNQEIALIEYEEYLLENDIRPSKANKNIKFKDLDGYNSYNMLHEIHNFLKHNSIDAYTTLKNDYPKKGK